MTNVAQYYSTYLCTIHYLYILLHPSTMGGTSNISVWLVQIYTIQEVEKRVVFPTRVKGIEAGICGSCSRSSVWQWQCSIGFNNEFQSAKRFLSALPSPSPSFPPLAFPASIPPLPILLLPSSLALPLPLPPSFLPLRCLSVFFSFFLLSLRSIRLEFQYNSFSSFFVALSKQYLSHNVLFYSMSLM